MEEEGVIFEDCVLLSVGEEQKVGEWELLAERENEPVGVVETEAEAHLDADRELLVVPLPLPLPLLHCVLDALSVPETEAQMVALGLCDTV